MSCPMCGNPRHDKYRPFCSKKCADVDLARWLNGSYRFESTREDDLDEDGDATAADKGNDVNSPRH